MDDNRKSVLKGNPIRSSSTGSKKKNLINSSRLLQIDSITHRLCISNEASSSLRVESWFLAGGGGVKELYSFYVQNTYIHNST